MEKFVFPGSITRELFSATVVGSEQYVIKDFSEIKCPICGVPMEICGLEQSNMVHEDGSVKLHDNVYVDDAGIPHCQTFGRPYSSSTSKITMRCPAGCVESMVVPVTGISIQGYQELHRG